MDELIEKLDETVAKLQVAENQLISIKAKELGLNLSPDLSKDAYLLTDNGIEKIPNGERGIVDMILSSNRDFELIDITNSLNIWANTVRESAGSNLVVWSEDSVLSKVTFQEYQTTYDKKKPTTLRINERVFVKIERFASRFDVIDREFFENSERRILTKDPVSVSGETVSKIFLEKTLGKQTHATIPTQTEADLVYDMLVFKTPEELRKSISLNAERLKQLSSEPSRLSEEAKLKLAKELSQEEVENMTPSTPEEHELRQKLLEAFKKESSSD